MLLHDLYTAVVPDNDHGRISEEEEPQPLRSNTPPTPPVHHQPSPLPPRPIRQRAMAQLRPVSIPTIVSDIAGPDPLRRIADFDRHYMPDGQPAAETSVCGNAGNLGTYDILSVLPDKFARFLFEFHAHRFERLDLPFLPADRSDFDVHGALLDDKVHEYVILCSVCTLYIYYINYNTYINYVN